MGLWGFTVLATLRRIRSSIRVNRGHDQNIAPYLLCPVNGACYYAPPWAPSGRVAHSLAFLEAPESAAHYVGVVDEDILIPVLGIDKAIALLLAEPRYRSLGHTSQSLL